MEKFNLIDIRKLKINNNKRNLFVNSINKIPCRCYQVEKVSDGRKIVIAKPGGKRGKGKIKNDIIVFILDPINNALWQVTHKQIYKYIKNLIKSTKKAERGKLLLQALKQVYIGKEPTKVLKMKKYKNVFKENDEAFLKAYKWI